MERRSHTIGGHKETTRGRGRGEMEGNSRTTPMGQRSKVEAEGKRIREGKDQNPRRRSVQDAPEFEILQTMPTQQDLGIARLNSLLLA